jgi:hypothetical protein
MVTDVDVDALVRGASEPTATTPRATSLPRVLSVESQTDVVDAPALAVPWLRVVELGESVRPRATLDGGLPTDDTTRSGVAARTAMVVADARQLFASSSSVTAPPASAQATT